VTGGAEEGGPVAGGAGSGSWQGEPVAGKAKDGGGPSGGGKLPGRKGFFPPLAIRKSWRGLGVKLGAANFSVPVRFSVPV
jgi:hypothetical protein